MIQPFTPQTVESARRARRRLLSVLGSPDGEQVLTDLEARFETHLPAFQGKAGSYDPMDAMRRDAHREVFLLIRRQLHLARQEATKTQQNHDQHHD